MYLFVIVLTVFTLFRHCHFSLKDIKSGKNAFARNHADPSAPFPDLKHVSDVARNFLAGIVAGIPDIVPMILPNINSYKRLVEGFWAPTTLSWGLENRLATVRLIAPPTCPPEATRIEFRLPGADAHPHLVIAAVLALGFRGIINKTEFPIPPLSTQNENVTPIKLANNLQDAVIRFMAPDSIAREVLGDEFVDHYGNTRLFELQQWNQAVTSWELNRYMELS